MWGEILQGLGAAGDGALDGYTWAKDYQQRDRGIDSRAEIARLNAELKDMAIKAGIYKHETPSGSVLAQQDGATARNDADNFTQTNIAEMLEGGRNARHATPSGNTLATQDGATERTQMTISARDLWNRMRDATTRRGQDAAVRGQDVALDVAVMRDDTSRARHEVEATAPRRQERPSSAAERSGFPLAGYEDRGGTSTRPDDIELSPPPALPPRRGLPERPWPPSEASGPAAGPSMREISNLRSQGVEARTAIDRFASMPVGDDFARGVRAAGVWPPPDAASAEEPSGRDAGGNRAQAAAVAAQLRNAIDAVRAARTPEDRKRATETLRRLRAEVRR